MEQLKELSKRPDIYERLTKSLAPNIWELDDVKKGLLCQVPFFTKIFFNMFCLSMLLEHVLLLMLSKWLPTAFWGERVDVAIWC